MATAETETEKPPKKGAPAKPVHVQALRDGTYPRPGETYPIYREKGSVFTLNDAAHFAEEWMRKVDPGATPALPAEPAPVPQTTGPSRKPSSNPFPPLG